MTLISGPFLGVLLATLAAFMFAFQFLFVRLGTRNGSVSDVILVSLLCNVLIVVPPAVLVYDHSMAPRAAAAFVGAGLFGSLFARICMFESIDRIGANRTSPIIASNVLFATILAVLLLDESLTGIHFIGIVLVVAGIAVVSYETAENASVDATPKEFVMLLSLPLLAAAFIGFEPIFVSYALDNGAEIVPGLAIAVSVAFVGFLTYTTVTSTLPSRSVIYEPFMKWYIGAGVATTAGLLAAFAALETAPVVIVAPIVQTSPLIVVALSALFLPKTLEKATARIVIAALMVVVGATVVTLSG